MTAGNSSRYRVLDLADESAVYGTRVLAALGADVIKIEPPDGGRPRRLPPLAATNAGEPVSLHFAYMNANKRSVTLDLKKPEGQRLFCRLASTSDVVLDTSPAGSMSEKGIGYEQMKIPNPRLIWVSITPFGLAGPRRDWKGSDLVAWASSGGLPRNGFPEGPPIAPSTTSLLAYMLASLNGAAGCLLALRSREATGRGQLVDISLQEVAIASQFESAMPAFLDDLIPRVRFGNRRSFSVPTGIFPCKDGNVQVSILAHDQWPPLAQWISEKTGNQAATDPLFADWHVRIQNKETIEEWVESLTLQYNKREFFVEAQKRRIPAAPTNTVADLFSDPQLAARDYWIESDHPQLGPVRVAGAPCRLAKTLWRTGPAPLPGEHNDVIYGELGLGASELAELRAKGVI